MRRLVVMVPAALALSLAIATPAESAIGPRHGGRLTLPSPAPVRDLDPARASTGFEATLAAAVFDGLYAIRDDGRVEPVLAAGPPEVTGTTARIRLRAGVRHHGTQPLRARHVVRSLLRTSTSPSAWLLGALASEGGRPMIREIDDATIEVELAQRGVRADVLFAASPFRVVVGGVLRRRPVGTGPYRARIEPNGTIDLAIYRHAPDGAPWIDRVRFLPAMERREEVRAFELGTIDGSWWGQTLYGGAPARPVETASATASRPVLLVPNRARALRDASAWGGVVRAIDRRRLERVGLRPRQSLAAGLPAPALPSGTARRGLTLRMPVRTSHPSETRVAEALAGVLDEHGVRLEVERLGDERYDAAITRGDWDLRLAIVHPPLPGPAALAGAALAAAGQVDRARLLAPRLGDPAVARAIAQDLGAMVLGDERMLLHHRADLVGVRFDALGRIPLADLSFARDAAPLPTSGNGRVR